MENKIFYEVQQHRQPIIWIIFGIIAAIVILSFLILLILKMDINTLLMFSIAVIVVIGIFLFMYNVKMVTEISPDKKILMKFFPFTPVPDVILLSEVSGISMSNYHPQKDYGGLGIRYNSKGKAYIMGGNTGVLLKFKDAQKKSVLIGSQKTEELFTVLQAQMQ